MKILVCMKQVPAGTKVDIDPETGAMKRLSGETRTNPYDLFALEAALQLREKVGGSVTVLTMGPPQADVALREALAMGCDEAYLLSAREFGGSDTFATSQIISAAINHVGYSDDDMILGNHSDRRYRSYYLWKADNRWRYRSGWASDRRAFRNPTCSMGV